MGCLNRKCDTCGNKLSSDERKSHDDVCRKCISKYGKAVGDVQDDR